MRRIQLFAASAAAALAATGALAVPSADAHSDTHRHSRTLATGLVSPLTLAVAHDGTAYVTQNFAGMLTRIGRHGRQSTLYRSTGGNEVGGVSVRGHNILFTETASGPTGEPMRSWLKRLTRHGKARTIADIRSWENDHNPDGRVVYGIRGIDRSCAEQWPTDDFGPASYRGIEDSHPYATYQGARGKTYVADAGMNAIISVSRHGRIRLVAVLPAVPVRITDELVSAFAEQGVTIPDCAVGRTYYGEPVPTDVEQAADGSLYVTTLGGGLGEMLPLGVVYRIRHHGHVRKVVGGLSGPVGLAIHSRHTLLVSPLFGGEISRVWLRNRHVSTFAEVNMPAAVQSTRRGVYATTDVLVGTEPGSTPGGKLVVFRHR